MDSPHLVGEKIIIEVNESDIGVVQGLIMTQKPIFIEAERRTAVLISMVEWESIQAKLMHRAPSDL